MSVDSHSDSDTHSENPKETISIEKIDDAQFSREFQERFGKRD